MQLTMAIDDYTLLAEVERLEGVEAVSGLFRYQLDVLVKGNRSFQEMIGKGVCFSLNTGQEQRLWHGMIKRVCRGPVVTFKSGRYTRYRLVIVPRLWLLTQSLRSRIFQGLSAVEFLKQVLQGQDATLPKEAMPARVLRPVRRVRFRLRQPADGRRGHLLLLRRDQEHPAGRRQASAGAGS